MRVYMALVFALALSACSVEVGAPLSVVDRLNVSQFIYDAQNAQLERACRYMVNAAGGVDCI